jgi:sulfur-carrier protein adenylyltransferase/sulfurtransferase
MADRRLKRAMEQDPLSREELVRYSRQLVLPEIGTEGQSRLKRGRVLCVGTGGLGSPAAIYLAASGVGTVGLADFDRVDLTNLHRQILHGTADVGRSKLESARDRLRQVNDQIEIVLHDGRLDSTNAMEVLSGYDVIVDGSDNFATRYLVSDACVLLGRPDVYGSVFRFEGQASVLATGDGPCYRCLYPEPPSPGTIPNCEDAGVLGVLPGLVGTIQATEALKILLGRESSLAGRLLLVDALRMDFRSVKVAKDAQCPACSEEATLRELIDYDIFCGGEPMEHLDGRTELSVAELKERIDQGDTLEIVDVREPYEAKIANIPGSKLIPLGEIRERLDELPADREIVVFCRTGKRSDMAARFLRDKGFRALNLEGGTHAWSDEIDPSQPKY